MNNRQECSKNARKDLNLAELVQSVLETFNLNHLNLAPKLGISVFTCSAGSLLALAKQYQNHRVKQKIFKWNFFHRLKYTLFSTFNLQSSFSFGCKVFMDNIVIYFDLNLNEYQKGAIVGLLSYLRNAPIKSIRQIQESIRGRNRQYIGYYEAQSFLTKTYGESRLYPGNFLINISNSVLFFTLYFGVYATLNSHTQHPVTHYTLNPLISTIVAMVPTFSISRIGNILFAIQMRRIEFTKSMGRKVMWFRTTIYKQLWNDRKNVLKLSQMQKRMQASQLAGNWILLVFFLFGQNILYPQLVKKGVISQKARMK